MQQVSDDTLMRLRLALAAALDARERSPAGSVASNTTGRTNMLHLQDAITLHDAEERLLAAEHIRKRHLTRTSFPPDYAAAPSRPTRPNWRWFTAPNGDTFGPYFTVRSLFEEAWAHLEDPDFQPPTDPDLEEEALDVQVYQDELRILETTAARLHHCGTSGHAASDGPVAQALRHILTAEAEVLEASVARMRRTMEAQ